MTSSSAAAFTGIPEPRVLTGDPMTEVATYLVEECRGMDAEAILNAVGQRWPELDSSELVCAFRTALEQLSPGTSAELITPEGDPGVPLH